MSFNTQDTYELFGQMAFAISLIFAIGSAFTCSWATEKEANCSLPNEAMFFSSVVLWAVSLILFRLSLLRHQVVKIAVLYFIPIPFVFWWTGLPGIRNKFLVIIGSQLGGYCEFKAKKESTPHGQPESEETV